MGQLEAARDGPVPTDRGSYLGAYGRTLPLASPSERPRGQDVVAGRQARLSSVTTVFRRRSLQKRPFRASAPDQKPSLTTDSFLESHLAVLALPAVRSRHQKVGR